MIKAILIDDELHCLETLSFSLKEYCPNVQIMDQCGCAKAGLASIEKHQPDLVFLDIAMPVINGFELLEHFKPLPFAVIFTTGYNQYAIKAIRFAALDYLLKTIDNIELVNAVAKIKERRQLSLPEQIQLLLHQKDEKRRHFHKIVVPTFEGFEMIPADEVVRCEAHDNYTYLFIKSKLRMIACRTLKDMEEQLQHFSYFVRVHHSHLANLNEVTKYVRGDGGYLVMSDGATVNVSRSYKESLMKMF